MDPSHILSPGYAHPLSREWQNRDIKIDASHLILPVFVLDIDGQKNEITSMPGLYQWSVDRLQELLDPLVLLGLRSVILFGVVTRVEDKSPDAACVHKPDNPVIRALVLLKKAYPSLYLICDVCICQYTSHGHCGIIENCDLGDCIDNDKSIELIATIACNYALAGADMVAPSDMMDGRIKAIKEMFMKKKWHRKVPVMSYSAKFASMMYGPFRDAANSKPMHGDRKSYQLPTGSSGLALRALKRDVDEGADFVMVKPGGSYLDIVSMAKRETNVPVSVYQVSGEYAEMIAGANAKVYVLRARVEESMVAFRRAGADIIISYFTPHILQWWSDDFKELRESRAIRELVRNIDKVQFQDSSDSDSPCDEDSPRTVGSTW